MGDYTKKGVKIGTTGQAYYATLGMLVHHNTFIDSSDPEVRYYIEPKNKCTFAFPFPQWDGKAIGEISSFHDNPECIIALPNDGKSYHQDIVHHVHPKGGEGVNLFVECPYGTKDKSRYSRNLDTSVVRFQIVGQKYCSDGSLGVLVKCIYCNETQVLDEKEAAIASEYLVNKAECEERQAKYYEQYPLNGNADHHRKRAEWLREVVKRLLGTYNLVTA